MMIVWKQDGAGPVEVLRFILFEPKNLRRRVTGQHRVASLLNQPGLAAKGFRKLIALRGSGDVSHHNFAGRMTSSFSSRTTSPSLLPAHSDSADLSPAFSNRGEAGLYGGIESPGPALRLLLQVPRRQPLDQAVAFDRRSDDLPRSGVEDHALGALGSAVNSKNNMTGLPERTGAARHLKLATISFASPET